jgi:hypothetical protein
VGARAELAASPAVLAKAAAASMGAAAKAAAVKAEEAAAELAAGVAARGEPYRPILRPSSKAGSLCRTNQRIVFPPTRVKTTLKPPG